MEKFCVSSDDVAASYLTPQPVALVRLVPPPVAAAKHESGCAAVKFQVGHDGKATNVTLLREYPASDGYGAALMTSIQNSTYKPADNENEWYFINSATKYVRNN